MAVSLVDLPTEILQLICGNLCTHCQHTTASAPPYFNTAFSRGNKETLARLCHVSSKLCGIAQPTLFHYFVINSKAKYVRAKLLRRQLPLFLRSIYQRPDLAEAVRALSLLEPAAWKDVYPVEDSVWAAIPEANRLILGSPGGRIGKESEHHVGRPAKLILRKITVLLLAATPNLEYLLHEVPSYETYSEWGMLAPLQRLRVLELVASAGRIFRVVDLTNIFRLTPQLEVLDMADASLLCAHHFSSDADTNAPKSCAHRPWEILPSTLRQITISNMEIFRLGRLFDHCLQLEDLRLFLISNPHWAWENVPPPNGAFEALRKTLRRLVVCMQNTTYVRGHEDFDNKTSADGIFYQVSLSLGLLDALEILEVDQCLLHAEVRRTQGSALHQLSATLPRQLKSLHIGYVKSWPCLEPQLYDLALQKSAGRLQNLAVLQVDPDLSEPIPPERSRGVQSALEDVGVDFIVGVNPRGSKHRQMLPPQPRDRDDQSVVVGRRPAFTLDNFAWN